MPPGTGALTCLRTLSEFPVGMEYGCTAQELKNMNDLRRRFCLSRLEKVASLDEVKVANLSNKQWLKKLQLWWSTQKRGRDFGLDDEIIEYLRPHTNLRDLRILGYGGSTLPSWITNPSFVNLESVTLFKCENLELLSGLGQLPCLESLSLYELNELRTIDFYSSCQDDIAIGDGGDVAAFPKLQKLEIVSMLHLEEWRDQKECDFPCLAEITVKDCPELVALMTRFGVPSLKYLEINNCSLLPSLPGGYPSIETLVIDSCPLLTSSCSKEDSRDRYKTLNIPNVFIDQIELHSGH